MKKILSICMALLMAFSVFAISASALEPRAKATWRPESSITLMFRSSFRQMANNIFEFLHVKSAIKATGVNLSEAKTGVQVGSTVTLHASVVPSDAKNKQISWKSADSSIASINDWGVVTGKKEGHTTIYAVAQDGGFYGECLVAVTGKTLHCTDLTLSKQSLEITDFLPSSSTESVFVTTKPVNTTDKVTISVSDPKIATAILDGNAIKISCKAEGTTTIKVKCGNVEKSIDITVHRKSGIKWNFENGVLTISGNEAIPDYKCGTACDKPEWYSFASEIKKIRIDGDVERIGSYAFACALNLEAITIPPSCKSIGAYFVYNESGKVKVDSLTLPEGLEKLDTDALNGCSINTLHFPSTLVDIGNYCDVNHGFFVSEKNPAFASESGVLYNKDMTELICFPREYRASEYVMPDTVRKLNDRSFSMKADSNLETIRFSGNLYDFGSNNYFGELKEANFKKTTDKKLGEVTGWRVNGKWISSLIPSKFSNAMIYVDDGNAYFSTDGYSLYSKDYKMLYEVSCERIMTAFREYEFNASLVEIVPGSYSFSTLEKYGTNIDINTHKPGSAPTVFVFPEGCIEALKASNINILSPFIDFRIKGNTGIKKTTNIGEPEFVWAESNDTALITFVAAEGTGVRKYDNNGEEQCSVLISSSRIPFCTFAVPKGTKVTNELLNELLAERNALEEKEYGGSGYSDSVLCSPITEFTADGNGRYFFPVLSNNVASRRGNYTEYKITIIDGDNRTSFSSFYVNASSRDTYALIWSALCSQEEFKDCKYSEEYVKSIITSISEDTSNTHTAYNVEISRTASSQEAKIVIKMLDLKNNVVDTLIFYVPAGTQMSNDYLWDLVESKGYDISGIYGSDKGKAAESGHTYTFEAEIFDDSIIH